jgi:hypothetical protein
MPRFEACKGEREMSEWPVAMMRSKEGVEWEGRRVRRSSSEAVVEWESVNGRTCFRPAWQQQRRPVAARSVTHHRPINIIPDGPAG